MKLEAFNYGREMAWEVLRDSRTFSGVCDFCGRDGALFEASVGGVGCIVCLTATVAEDEAKGGHLSEWMWEDACRVPQRSSRLYREAMRGFFRALSEEVK
jgi:hypothetical protein